LVGGKKNGNPHPSQRHLPHPAVVIHSFVSSMNLQFSRDINICPAIEIDEMRAFLYRIIASDFNFNFKKMSMGVLSICPCYKGTLDPLRCDLPED
jgi:hypothetical protein